MKIVAVLSAVAVGVLAFIYLNRRTEISAKISPVMPASISPFRKPRAFSAKAMDFNEAFEHSDYCAMVNSVLQNGYIEKAPEFFDRLWQNSAEAPASVEIHSRAIQEALYQPSFEKIVQRLSGEKHWRPKFFLALLHAGMMQGNKMAPVNLDYPQALSLMEEIEKAEPNNAFIAVFKARILDKLGLPLEQVRAYLKRELPRRRVYDSPMDSVFQDLAVLATQDPRLMALLPIYSANFPSPDFSFAPFFLRMAGGDALLPMMILQFADGWQRSLLRKMDHRLSEHFTPLIEYTVATGLARKYWEVSNPRARMPERYAMEAMKHNYDEIQENSLPELRQDKYLEDQAGTAEGRACDGGLKKAAENDAETLRDRLRKMNGG